jgi:hypothetical protein
MVLVGAGRFKLVAVDVDESETSTFNDASIAGTIGAEVCVKIGFGDRVR